MVTVNSIVNSAVFSYITRASEARSASVLNLVSGFRTNANVADFSVGTLLSSKSLSLRTAIVNAGQGKSLLQTAKSALTEIVDLIEQQKALAVEATDSSLTDNERATLNQQFQDITDTINLLVSSTTFNDKVLLNGSISGTAALTTDSGQSTENYSLLATTDYSVSGDTEVTGGLDTTTPVAFVATQSVGDTYASTTITLTHDGGGALAGNAAFEIDGQSVSFGIGNTTTAQLGTSLIAALEASTNASIRRFTYESTGAGIITVTAADKGTANTINTLTFQLTNTGGGRIATATLGTATNIKTVTSTITAAAGSTTAANRTVAAGDRTLDPNLQGELTNFTATLDTSTGPQNQVTFTADVNGVTYTSQVVNLFGTGGYNSQGNKIKTGQVITFYNTLGPTDDAGEYTDNVFTLTVGGSDITVSGSNQTEFETDLTDIAQGFETQLAENRINQSRDIILDENDPSGGDFTISSADGTPLEGLVGFDSVDSTNVKGDIQLVSDSFGPTGLHGRIGAFAFNSATHELTTTIAGEVYTADLSDNTADTGGFVDGTGGSYNDSTYVLTIGAGTTIVFHSADVDDGRELRIDLSNVTDTEIALNTADAVTAFTDGLDQIFGVDEATSLSFQVGDSSDNTITVALDSAATAEIYLDDNGVPQSPDISTEDGAAAAEAVLDNALNAVLAILADVNGGITSFTASISANTSIADNYDAASSALLNTDYSLESTLFAESTLRLNAGIAVLAQLQAQTQAILKLVGF